MTQALMSFRLMAASAALAISGSALATGAVSFEGQGYLLDVVVGDTDGPRVAGLSIAAPGSGRSTQVPLDRLRVDVFDVRQKLLVLRFENPKDPALPGDFSLMVRGDHGILHIDGKAIAGQFSWDM